MLNGDPTDNNAHLFKRGASSVFSQDGVKIAKSYDTRATRRARADEMQQAITALGNDGFAGVYDANDGIATGAITAMKDAGINPASRPTTGQDAELDGIQRILAGQQYMTVYKAVKTEAQDAARWPSRWPRAGRCPRISSTSTRRAATRACRPRS